MLYGIALSNVQRVAGIQLAKMSPFRSYVVTTASTLTATVVNLFHPGGGTTTYINVSLTALHCNMSLQSHLHVASVAMTTVTSLVLMPLTVHTCLYA